jgi:DNA-binding MarR family transcriptional regulator
MDWELISYMKRSKQRVSILNAFHSADTPTEIAKITALAPSHVSRALKEFCAKGIIECKNPKDKIGRLYQPTKTGQEVLDVIKGGDIAEKYSK